MKSKEAVKRIAFSIPFHLAQEPSLVIGIKGYALINDEKKRLPVKVDLDTRLGEQVITKTIYKDGNTGEVIDFKTQVKKYFSVGKAEPAKGTKDEKFFFDPDEVNKMKVSCSYSICLLKLVWTELSDGLGLQTVGRSPGEPRTNPYRH